MLEFALKLPAGERAALAQVLLLSLDEAADGEAAQPWNAELAPRLDDLECDKARALEVDEALARVDARLRGC